MISTLDHELSDDEILAMWKRGELVVRRIPTSREEGCICTDPSFVPYGGHENRCPLSTVN